MNEDPSQRLLSGEVGDPLYVLSVPEIRNAEVLTTPAVLQTADGDVTGRVGDVVVTAYGGERYPIPATVFYGAYEVLGQVRNRLVARRLIHVRTAWPVTSEFAEFDYGAGRGVVSVARGGWLYKSDDDDLGVINPDVKLRGHLEVGHSAEVERVDWPARFEKMALFLTFLPPVLTVMALLSRRFPHENLAPWVPAAMNTLETVLLLSGVASIVWMRYKGWGLKAAVSAGAHIASKFQIAAALLGEKPSKSFPHMALWRAAQMHGNVIPAHRSESVADNSKLAEIRERVGSTLAEMNEGVERSRRTEHMAEAGEVAAIIIVIVSNIGLIANPEVPLLELLPMWLPSVIGALHSLSNRKRSSQRAAILTEFMGQLQFIRTQLQALDASSPSQSSRAAEDAAPAREASLRLLCRIVAQYCQEELRLAISQRPSMPV